MTLIIFIPICFFAFSTIFYTLYFGVGPVFTSKKVLKKLFAQMPTTKKQNVYELGSGWGRIVFALAKKYENWQIVGYEVSFLPYFFSLFLKILGSYNCVDIKRKNFLLTDFSDGDLFICYLCPSLMKKIERKFIKEAKCGAVLLTHTFSLPNIIPETVVHADDLYRTKIYLYRKEGI